MQNFNSKKPENAFAYIQANGIYVKTSKWDFG